MAKANENRDWRIYADFAQVLIRSAWGLNINDPFALELKHTAHDLDFTQAIVLTGIDTTEHFHDNPIASDFSTSKTRRNWFS